MSQLLFLRNIGRVLLVLTICYLAFAPIAFAGFGITPPYVRNTSLTRNSIYEQQILLVRGNPNEPLNAEISVDAPEIQDWIEIVEGNVILLPKGEQKVPMTVRVTVPNDAQFRDYSGKIRIRTNPTDEQIAEGMVSISLGAQVDVSLSVIDKVIKDFRVRRVSIDDLSEGHKIAWLYFPGKVNFRMLVENTGNVKHSPTSVNLRIYDRNGSVLLQDTVNTNRVKKIQPYATEEVIAELPTHLPAGNYLARYTIYNGEEIKQEGEMTMSIKPYGSIQTAGYGFGGLSIPHKLSLLLPIFSIMICALYLIYTLKTRRRKNS